MKTARADLPPPEPGSDASQWAALRLAAMMTAAGTMHFVTPTFFDRIIPPVLPGSPRTYTHVSGVTAYGIAAALALPRTRRVGGTVAAIFFVAVIPAKIQLTINWFRDENTTSTKKASAIIQLPWQIPLITEALKARRNARYPSR